MNDIELAIQAVIKAYEVVGDSGGELHIVLDDMNTEDEDIMYCKEGIDKLARVQAITDVEEKVYMHCIDELIKLRQEVREGVIERAFNTYCEEGERG